ncbi:hypothetical protein CHISP_3364 [Chitinispirillum alkaliphilum]|nr:hypothetical protein CHISP_3364 [Chitinispirillum alkaliphilum]
MRYAVAILSVLMVCFGAGAQDGFYGTFLLGQKTVDFEPLNQLLRDKLGAEGDLFPNKNLTLGGQGHVIINNSFVLGGKAFGISHERVIHNDDNRRVRITSGMGVGSFGYNFIPENRAGVRLYPKLGLGVSSFFFQSKKPLPPERRVFEDLLVSLDDEIITLGKLGMIVDLGVGLDIYKPFRNFFVLLPGLDFGLLLHAQAGYSFVPGDIKWRRDFDMGGQDQVEGGPDLKFDGFYFNFGLGFGFSN